MKITSLVCALWLGVVAFTSAADKKIVLIAGKPSHPPGMHEFRAGMLLFQKCLSGMPGLSVTVYSNGWPEAASALEGADAVVIYADGQLILCVSNLHHTRHPQICTSSNSKIVCR